MLIAGGLAGSLDPDVLSEMRSLDFDTYNSDGLRNLIHSDIYDSHRSRTLTFANAQRAADGIDSVSRPAPIELTRRVRAGGNPHPAARSENDWTVAAFEY